MRVTSCVGQQEFMFLRTVACLCAHEWVHIIFWNQWGRKTQTDLSQSG